MEPKSAFVQIPGVRIHYTDWGDNGPPFIFLHGGRLTGRSWDAVARGLSKRFHVVAMDARGHGDSEKPPRGYSYDQRLTDLNNVLDALGWRNAFGMAHSTGAMAMAMHAVKHQGRLSKVVLIEPPVRQFRLGPGDGRPQPADGAPAPTPAGGESAKADLVASPPASRGFQPPGATAGAPPGATGAARGARPGGRSPAQQRRSWPSRDAMEQYLRAHPETGLWREDVMVDVVKHGAVDMPDGSVEMKWSPDAYNTEDGALNNYSLIEEAVKIKVPTLLMYGTRGIAQEEGYRALAKNLAQTKLIVVEGAGHNIYMEDPDLVIGAVQRFITTPLNRFAPGGYEDSRMLMAPDRILAKEKAAPAAKPS